MKSKLVKESLNENFDDSVHATTNSDGFLEYIQAFYDRGKTDISVEIISMNKSKNIKRDNNGRIAVLPPNYVMTYKIKSN